MDWISHLTPGCVAYISGCAAESTVFHRGLNAHRESLNPVTFTGVFVPKINDLDWLFNAQSRVQTFFWTPRLKTRSDQVDFYPLCYSDILTHFLSNPPDIGLIMVSPPDQDGNCSLGIEVGILGDIWRKIPTKIGHINPSMPKTPGHPGIPVSEFTSIIEADDPVITAPDPEPDEISIAIAKHVGPFIEDGATLQTGIGKLPGAILRSLTDRKKLRLHTGLIGDGLIALQDAHALDETEGSCVAGVAIGSEKLYSRLDCPNMSFQPVSITHSAKQIGDRERFVAINSALEVDLYGQAYAELTPKGLMSGPGGASDFARGARLGKGVSIITLPSTAGRDGAISRIVAPKEASGLVSLGRMDVDVVVTEHGAADLRGCSHDSRARALISIAAPQHREALDKTWRETAKKF